MGSESDGWHDLAVTAPPFFPAKLGVAAGVVVALLLVLAAVTRTPGLVYWAAFVALATAALFGVDALRRATARQVRVSATELLVRGPIRSERYALREVLAVRVRAITRSSNNGIEQARRVCVDLADGRTVDLPIQGRTRDHVRRSLLFPDLLTAAEFDRALAHLRDLVAQHQP